MLTKNKQDGFDAAVWRGPIDVKTVTVRLSMLFGLGVLWLSLVVWFLYAV